MGNFIVFFIGFNLGVLTVCAWAIYAANKIAKQAKASNSKMETKLKAAFNAAAAAVSKEDSSVRQRLNKVQDLTQEQLGILGMMDKPQSGPLEGRNRKYLQAQLTEIEEEKLNLMKSIIKDGFNPKIKILNDQGEVETITLESFLDRKKDRDPPVNDPTPKKPKLTLVKGDDK